MDLGAIWRRFRKKEIGRKSGLFLHGKTFIFALPLLVAAAPGPEGSVGGVKPVTKLGRSPALLLSNEGWSRLFSLRKQRVKRN